MTVKSRCVDEGCEYEWYDGRAAAVLHAAGVASCMLFRHYKEMAAGH